MEKIKITVEQEKALNQFTRQHTFADFVKGNVSFEGSYNSLEFFSDETFSLLLNGWYEVEQIINFKAGDWVFESYPNVPKSKMYHKIEKITKRDVKTHNGLETNITYAKEYFEKVTEPWKIMLLELGREKPKFKKGDSYEYFYIHKRKMIHRFHVVEDEYEKNTLNRFETERVVRFSPVENSIKVNNND